MAIPPEDAVQADFGFPAISIGAEVDLLIFDGHAKASPPATICSPRSFFSSRCRNVRIVLSSGPHCQERSPLGLTHPPEGQGAYWHQPRPGDSQVDEALAPELLGLLQLLQIERPPVASARATSIRQGRQTS